MGEKHVRFATGFGLAAVIVVLGFTTSGLFPAPARAEAPFFHDPLADHVDYDPEFFPLNRSTGLISLMGQAWSRPDLGHPDQALTNQDYWGEYRFQWVAALDPAYTLAVELKGSDRGHLVADDYFLKSEFLYQGLEAPLYLYGGIKLPEKDNFLFYGGLESMSYRLRDAFPNLGFSIPVGLRGFSEVRWTVDEPNPTLRFMALAHTLPDFVVRDLTVSVGADMFFHDAVEPRWLLEGHIEYAVPYGRSLRWSVITGYEFDLRDPNGQRLSLGVRTELF